MAAVTFIKIPYLNPFRILVSNIESETYFKDSIPAFEKQLEYYQPVNQGDICRFQVDYRYNPIPGRIQDMIDITGLVCSLHRCDTNALIMYIDSDTTIQQNNYLSIIHSFTAPLVDGYYYIKITAPTDSTTFTETIIAYSEPFHVLAYHENSTLIKYTNSGIEHDVYFYDLTGNQQTFYYRVKGGFKTGDFTPNSLSNVYINQTHNNVLLSGVPFNSGIFTLSDNRGVPNYVVDIVNRILCCDTVYINDIQYSKTEGAAWDKQFANSYPMGIWKIELAESVNNSSKYVTISDAITGYVVDNLTMNIKNTNIVNGIITINKGAEIGYILTEDGLNYLVTEDGQYYLEQESGMGGDISTDGDGIMMAVIELNTGETQICELTEFETYYEINMGEYMPAGTHILNLIF